EKVFLDLKIHDIPNTAGKAVAEAAECGASMVTVHASGGEAMLRACALASPLILGVTLLTSIDDRELQRIGFSGTALDASLKLALLAQKCGLRGVVASPQEIEAIRRACGDDLIIVTPGIRVNGATDDQRRTATPAAAIPGGANYNVDGQPITTPAHPRGAAQANRASTPCKGISAGQRARAAPLPAAGHDPARSIRLQAAELTDHIDERSDGNRVELHLVAHRVRNLLVHARIAALIHRNAVVEHVECKGARRL